MQWCWTWSGPIWRFIMSMCLQVRYLSIVGIKEGGGPLVGGGKPGGGTVMGNPAKKTKKVKNIQNIKSTEPESKNRSYSVEVREVQCWRLVAGAEMEVGGCLEEEVQEWRRSES